MSEPRPGADIDAYLRQYRDKYTRDAMAAKLIEAGHDPAAVEAALARLESEHVDAVEGAIKAADTRAARARRVTRIIVLSVYGLACLWLIAGLGVSANPLLPGNLAFIVLAIALGVLVAWLIGRTESIAAMVAWSVVAIVIGLPVALLGACLVGLKTGPG
jgi:anti-sigma factor RsiW